MSVTTTAFVSLLALSGLLSALVATDIYRNRRKTVGARVLVLTFAGQATWSLAYTIQLTTADVGWWMVLDRFLVTGVTAVTTGWFVFALTYTGFRQRLSATQLAGLLLPAATGVALAWTNHYHGLFWRLDPPPEVLMGTVGRYLQFEGGVAYSPWELWLFGLVVATLSVLGAKYVRAQSLHRAQVGVVFVGILLPLVGNVVFRVVSTSSLAVDITPILFTATGLLVVTALIRYRMLDSVPVSQHALLEQLSDAVVVTGEDTEVRHANASALDIFGGDIVGERLAAHLPSGTSDVAALTETGLSIEVDGRERHFDVERTGYADQRGAESGAVYVFQDVTDRHERTRALTRQNERLNRFASLVSHDLRNPLTVTSSHLELVRDEVPEESVESMERNLDRMERMIDDLLALARAGQTVEETEPVALAEVMRDARSHAETEGATVDIRLPDDVTVLADRDRLLHVFENLVRNAVDHNDPPVTVRVGPIAATEADGASVVGCYLEDDGRGIPAEDRDEVFDHGYTTDAGGTGLGLAIVQDVVEAHGWEVAITDGADGGARFEITGMQTDR